MPGSECLIVIPAHNEEQNIGKTLQEIRTAGVNSDILVVDDGSTDKTAEIAQAAGVKVIRLPFNLGYGGALQTGFKYAAEHEYNCVVQFDADGQHNPEDIRTIIHLLKSRRADIIIGSRFLGKGSFRVGLLKMLVIGLFRFIVKITTGTRITDPTSGLQGLSRRTFFFYASMGNFPEDFPDADTLIFMLSSNYRVEEFPANMRQRYSGQGMHAGLKASVYFVKVMVSILVVMLRKKNKVEDA